MTFKAIVSFNSSAHADYASSDHTFEGLWSYDYSSGTCLMLNMKTGADAADNLLFFPWYSITKVEIVPEAETTTEESASDTTSETASDSSTDTTSTETTSE